MPAPKINNQADDAPNADIPKDPDEDADGRKLPAVAWTTFHSWAEVGDWYRSLSLERAQPNDALRARAADITKDARTTNHFSAIYTFVSTRTRYVGIDFGIGRYRHTRLRKYSPTITETAKTRTPCSKPSSVRKDSTLPRRLSA